MSANYDNWERLVDAVLKKQQLWELFHEHSRSPSILSEASDLSSSSPFDDLASLGSSPGSHRMFPKLALGYQIMQGSSNRDTNVVINNREITKPELWMSQDAGINDDVMKRIMSAEVSCEVNQLPPHLIFVNGKPLSIQELVCLQSCVNPPKKLKPGKYWYDKVSGLWGKDGEKPSQVISPHLALGYQIIQGASNGDTNVVINNREITKPELWMLQAAGINCDGNPHFWVTADGSVQREGMKNVFANLWERKIVKLLCAVLSLPYPSASRCLES